MAIPPDPPLRIKEEDGSPNVIPVFQITVSNGTLTDEGAGKVRFGTASGGGTGASTANTYIVVSPTGDLSAERVLEVNAPLTIASDATTVTISSTTQNVTTVQSSLTIPIIVDSGGTGQSTHTNLSLLSGSGGSPIHSLGVMAAGAMVVGSSADLHPGLFTSGGAATTLVQSGGAPFGLAWVDTSDLFKGYVDGHTGGTAELYFGASDLIAAESSFATLSRVSGDNVILYVRAFDQTINEAVNGKFHVPGDLWTTGSVTLRAYALAATVSNGATNVRLDLKHRPLNDAEDFDPSPAYLNTFSSGDLSISTTQDQVNELTWTEAVSTLTWAANDEVVFRFSRTDASVAGLNSDLHLHGFAVEIPIKPLGG